MGVWLRNSPLFQVIGNPFSDGIVFKYEPLPNLAGCRRVEKSEAILALLDGFQELHLDW